MLHRKPETGSFTTSRKNELFAQLLSSIELKFDSDNGQACGSIGEWAESSSIILDGRPFTFDRHEYLRVPYEDRHPDQVEMKATQLGLTSMAMLRAMYAARYGNYRGILYLFPSKSDVLDFSKGRISPLIADNPETIGRWVTDTDAAGIKKIWNTFLYLRGMVSRVGLKSIPVDLITFDELDEAPQKAVDKAQERMGHRRTEGIPETLQSHATRLRH